MSLIDQALKKTQSALHPQKVSTRRTDTFSNTPSEATPRTQAPLFSRANIMDFFTHRWILSLTSFVFAMSIAWVAHHHIVQITQRYEHFYGHLYQNVAPQKLNSVPPIKKIAQPQAQPTPAVIPLQLEGTLQVGSEHVAMINQALVHKNQVIDGYRVEKVKDNAVDLQNITTHQDKLLTQTLSK